jgi:hypothetical protein
MFSSNPLISCLDIQLGVRLDIKSAARVPENTICASLKPSKFVAFTVLCVASQLATSNLPIVKRD